MACVPLDGVVRTRHSTATSSSSSSYALRGGSPAIASASSSSSSDTSPSCVWVRTLICNTVGLKNSTHPWRGGAVVAQQCMLLYPESLPDCTLVS